MAYLILNLETGEFLTHVRKRDMWDEPSAFSTNHVEEVAEYAGRLSAEEALQKLRDSELYEIVEYSR